MKLSALASPTRRAAAAAVAMTLSMGSAFGQEALLQTIGWKPKHDATSIVIESCPTPAAPAAPAPAAPQAAPPAMDDPSLSAERSAVFAGDQVAVATPNMIGDFLHGSGGFSRHGAGNVTLGPNQFISPGNPPFLITVAPNGSFTQTPLTRAVGQGRVRVPSSAHIFKISDNNNAMPQDRVLFGYNYFNDVNGGINRAQGIPGTMDVHQEIFGFEKTFLDGRASVGMRVPVQTLADGVSDVTNTGVGNLSIAGKFLIAKNCDTGSMISGGLAVVVPTGPTGYAGTDVIGGINNTMLQPFISYIYRNGSFYLLGFSAIDAPTNSRDVSLLFNDVSVGYYLYENRSCESRISAIIPTVELHVNTPLNHVGAGDFADPFGTADWISVTSGVTLQFGQRTSLAVGVGVPLTGPQPYAFEAIAQFNYSF